MSDRINWGVIARLRPPEQYERVRQWVDTHKPGDPGYEPAERWLARRDHWRRILENTRPEIERAYAAFKERRQSPR